MADDSRGFRLFGFEIKRQDLEDAKKKPSIVPARDDDGAGYITASGTHYGQYINLDGDDSKDNYQLIMRYRGVSMHPEVDAAIEDIVNESIAGGELEQSVDIKMEELKQPDNIKKQIKEEFDNIISMLNFNEYGHDIFRRWYVDGRIYHHLVVNESQLKAGIQEIRYIDSSKMRKVKQIKKKKDPQTGANLIEKVDEYYIYQEKPGQQNSGVKMSLDSVSYVTSGLLDEGRKKVLSYLHKALKPLNQLRMMEDSLVIYRLARAPERRIFYIDVGNLPRGKAEQYMKDIMTRYRNKLVYDSQTGEIKDDRKHQSLLEDFWLPRREGGRGTEISTLPGGDNLGQIDDIVYFQKKLYRALNVPINRLEQEAQFSLGRSTEISRDELKFQKFIDRLRTKFSALFMDILKTQLMLKGIITEEDWNLMKNDIVVDYVRDNHFTELKDLEILREKTQTLDMVHNYVDVYFSREWIMKNVLHFNDEDIEQMVDQHGDETEKLNDLEPDKEAGGEEQ
ncbi:MAG: portal protein [Verrucomicrobiales bacterium]|nr:portal protein [Verrucomicrobiales bacterium]|tara:strand:+ start:8024 stop:9547 length:1524 start_codon:yes stop_codon:yes gene_type:complete